MRQLRHSILGAACCALAVFTAGCGPQQPAVDTRADEATIRDLEVAWSKSAGSKQLEQVLSYYADDASSLWPNAPLATGKEAIRKAWAQLFDMPGLAMSWQTLRVEVSREGDLAYAQGTYDLAVNDAKGNAVKDHGKFMDVFKKQADGKWKAVADMFNSDLPPPPAK